MNTASFIDDFYPTPPELIAKMLEGLDLDLIEDVLDLGAGRGEIPQYIIDEKERKRYSGRHYYGGRALLAHIDAVEINPDFQHILRGKEFRVVHGDILTFETFKVYHLIIGNLPFSIGAECLQRALALVERSGGHLRVLVNAETLKNPYTYLRKSLVNRLEELGAEIEYLPGEFVRGERPTGVEAALVKLHLERPEAPSIILENMKQAEAAAADAPRADAQLVEADFASAMVSRFNLEARAGIRLIQEYRALRPYILDRIKSEGDEDKYDYSKPLIKLEVEGASDYRGNVVNSYLSGLREKYWSLLINDPRFYRLYTSNILNELQSKLKELRDYDFTLFNIGELIREMRGKIVKGIEDSILELFDHLTRKFTWDESIHNGNVHYFNGWKTNKAYKINKKVILPMNGFSAYDKKRLDYEIRSKLSDMVKVFNYLSNDRENVALLVGNACESADRRRDFDIDLRYFRVKFFLKGTAHIWFTDEALLAKFNIFGAQRKGWLPPAYGKKHYEAMDVEERDVVDSFQGREAYDEIVRNAKFYIVEVAALLQLGAAPEAEEAEQRVAEPQQLEAQQSALLQVKEAELDNDEPQRNLFAA